MRSTERAALLKTDREFSQFAASNGVAAAFLEYITDDATIFPMMENPVTGRDAIRENLAALAGAQLLWQPTRAEVARAGDFGFTWGTYEFRGTGPQGESRVSFGKYVSIWKKQRDGTWKLYLDIGNPSPAPSAR